VTGAVHNETEAANPFDAVANGSAGNIFHVGPFLNDLTRWVPGRDWAYMETLVAIAFVLGIVAAVAVASRWRRFVLPALCLLVLAYTVDATRFTVPRNVLGIDSNFPHALEGVRDTAPDFVDRAVPDDSLVGLQVGTLGVRDEQNQWLWTDFWNKSIQRSYSFDGFMGYSGWPGNKWELDDLTGRLTTGEVPDYLVVSQIDPALRVQGRVVARSAYNAVVLQPAQPLRAAWALDRTPPGGHVQLFVYPSEPGAAVPELEVTIKVEAVPPEEGELTVPYRLKYDGPERERTIAPGETRTFTLRPRPIGGGRYSIAIQQRAPKLQFAEGHAVIRISSVKEPGT